MRLARAFTLIELLIVVAIIAILATIAVPNFLYAQTRTKMARVVSDLRTLTTAIEAYSADYNLPPLDWKVSRGDPMWPGMLPSTSGILHPGYLDPATGIHPGLTTPIAYVTNCWITDPFVKGESLERVPFDQQKYSYNWFEPTPLRGAQPNTDYAVQNYASYYGYWRLGSIGPDQDYFNGAASPYVASRVYDPTNGILSSGNIWRSQKEPQVRSRPELDLLIDP
jgi:prepilin-type N-terminal cleavage/methylation domain-containing protein